MITDFRALAATLDAVNSSTRMAILHGEAEVAEGRAQSDVDMCLGEPAPRVLGRVVHELAEQAVYLVLTWHYDRGGYSAFVSNEDGTAGAHIDMVCDPRGVNLYGIRTDRLLAARVQGARWPRLAPVDEALYVVRKRRFKHDENGTRAALDHLHELDAGGAPRREQEIFGQNGAHWSGRRVWLSRLFRPSRLLRRTGFWAVVPDRPLAELEEAARGFDRILIRARATSAPSSPHAVEALMRPQLLVSLRGSRFPSPDTVLARTGDDAPLGRALVQAMHRRVVERLAA